MNRSIWRWPPRHAWWPIGKQSPSKKVRDTHLYARSPLASKLLGRIFALYFSVALIVTVAQAYLQYGAELARVQSEVAAAVQLIEPALSKTMWNIDKPGTAAIATGLSRNKSLVGLRLDGDQSTTVGLTPDHPESPEGPGWKTLHPKLYDQAFSIRHPESDHPDKLIGTLHVYVSAGTVLERAFDVLLTIGLSAIIKTAALWLILYFTVKRMIARPLTRLADRLNQIDREHDAELAPKLDSSSSKTDEMTFLLRSFIAMRRALRRSKRNLLSYQSELEQKVADRTRDLHDQAMHDPLTGLPNRRAFANVMADLMCQPIGEPTKHVLCLIDLDHFKLLNDTFGHAAGDQVLVQIAELFKRQMRPTDTIARMGGDEFAIIMRDCSPSEAQTKINGLQKGVSSMTMERNGHRVPVGMSAGLVAFSARTGDDLQQAIESADAACYSAKESGRHQVKVFGEGGSGLRRKSDVKWINIIHKALAEDLFLLYVQPIHAVADNTLRAAEVLIRLEHNGTIVQPDAFLPAAERYGLSTRIDMWVFENTLRYMAAHPEFVERVGTLHVNLSASAIADPPFYRFALRQLRQHPALAGKICLEVTENVVIEKLDNAVRSMNGLRRRGVTFSLDDFGHGASSYTYLQTLPVDQVKIDGRFVKTIAENEVSLAIVRSMADIAHMAGMSTVAEYVESEAIVTKLRELKIDYLQGNLFGQAMPIETLRLALLAAQPLNTRTNAPVRHPRGVASELSGLTPSN